MVQFKRNASSNLGQNFPNHFMNVRSETQRRSVEGQSKLNVQTSFAETLKDVPWYMESKPPVWLLRIVQFNWLSVIINTYLES